MGWRHDSCSSAPWSCANSQSPQLSKCMRKGWLLRIALLSREAWKKLSWLKVSCYWNHQWIQIEMIMFWVLNIENEVIYLKLSYHGNKSIIAVFADWLMHMFFFCFSWVSWASMGTTSIIVVFADRWALSHWGWVPSGYCWFWQTCEIMIVVVIPHLASLSAQLHSLHMQAECFSILCTQ